MKKYFLLLLLIPTSALTQPATNGLIGYWPFDGNSNDTSGGGNHLTIFGSPTLTEDKNNDPNTAFDFDGVNDYMTLPNKFTFSGNSFTIGFWLLLRQDGRGGFFQYHISGQDWRGVRLAKDGAGVIAAGLRDVAGNSIYLTIPEKLNVWTKYDMTYDHTTKTLKLYENGLKVQEEVNSGINNDFGESLHQNPRIMSRLSGEYVNGKFDELIIYNRALSEGEILDLFNDLPAPPQSSTICEVVFCDNGNVGIGTDNTQGYKLAVAGNIITEEIKVALQSDWPDFVFEDEYDLRTLEEIKVYIQKNKHLPEIPSALEVEENGIDLGDMSLRLLKKIEELTLHLIEQNERVEQLEKEVSALKNK